MKDDKVFAQTANERKLRWSFFEIASEWISGSLNHFSPAKQKKNELTSYLRSSKLASQTPRNPLIECKWSCAKLSTLARWRINHWFIFQRTWANSLDDCLELRWDRCAKKLRWNFDYKAAFSRKWVRYEKGHEFFDFLTGCLWITRLSRWNLR